ncbi:MAG: bile acid:sodium symporter family protein [Planctomycetota bacterium]
MKFKIDGFMVGMAIAVFLAWLFPDPGAKGGVLHPELVTKAGVALIFFLHGVVLSFESLKYGVSRWRLHLVVQMTTFLFFPLLGLLLLSLFGRWMSPDLKLGFFYLCALPSTVSSSVALTAAARGNVPAAVFNATLSSLLGVFLTPAWMAWFSSQTGESLPYSEVILDLTIWLVLPLVAGQLLHPLLGDFAKRWKGTISKVDRGTILLLVYTSFCDSMKWGVFWKHGLATVAWAVAGSAVIFFLVFQGTDGLARSLGFSTEDGIAVVFCGTKKTLASGIPMAQLMFGMNPGISLILLPIMIYHPLQLIICGMYANHWGSRDERTA